MAFAVSDVCRVPPILVPIVVYRSRERTVRLPDAGAGALTMRRRRCEADDGSLSGQGVRFLWAGAAARLVR
jgi:hypothetical protein